MLPIYLTYDIGVDEFKIRAIMMALIEFKKLRPKQKITVHGSKPWSTGDYSSADWYIKSAKRIFREDLGRVQLDADSILTLLENEPWQEQQSHIDLFFTSYDLSLRGINFCFGIARGRNTVQSVYRFRRLCADDREIAIKTLVWHELGHIFGLASDLSRSNTRDCCGPHCTNEGCAMCQGVSVKEWVMHAREVKKYGMIYCSQCMDDLRRARP